MKLNLKSKFKNLLSMRFSKLIIGIVVVAIVAGVGLTNKTVQAKLFGKKAAIVQNLATVKKGNIQVLVSGSGPIYFTNASKLYSKINATVTAANFKVGDKVKKGDIIYEFDTSDAQSSISDNQNALEKSQLAASTNNSDLSKLTITAPISGQVTNIAVSDGATVKQGDTILTITDTSKLQVSLPFNAADIGKIAVGQTADVNITSLMQSVKGTVTNVSSQSTATDSGSKLYAVEIQLSNPGALNAGMVVNADINASSGTVSSTSTAAMGYTNKQAVTSQAAGTVQGISATVNEKISAGHVITTLQSDSLTTAVKSANLDIAGAQAKVDTAVKQLDNYKIMAPYDGVITLMNNKVGDAVKPGDEVADIADPTKMEFDVPVDELDVAKLATGQKTNITVDALPVTTTTPLIGEVAKIPVTGTAASGVTTFPITINVDGNLSILKGGMNANADIVVSNKENILYVPIEAITKIGTKSYVWIKGTAKGGSGFPGGGAGFQGGGTRSTGATGTTGSTGSTGGAATTGGTGSTGGAATTGGTGTTGKTGSTSGTGTTGKTASTGAVGGSTGTSTSAEATVNTKINSSNGGSGAYSGTRTRSASTSKSKVPTYYTGDMMVEVEVGANNDTDIEITSGLNEGDRVVLPETKAASTKAATTGAGGMGGGGNAGGGARSGGGF